MLAISGSETDAGQPSIRLCKLILDQGQQEFIVGRIVDLGMQRHKAPFRRQRVAGSHLSALPQRTFNVRPGDDLTGRRGRWLVLLGLLGLLGLLATDWSGRL